MVAEVITAINSIKSAADILKTLINVRDTNMINGAVAEVNSLLINVQNEVLQVQVQNAELLARKRELENELNNLTGWETEKNRYLLNELFPNLIVYTLKDEEAQSEPKHHLCPQCFNAGKKSIIQCVGDNREGYQNWKCFQCDFNIEYNTNNSSYKYTRVPRPNAWGL